MPLLTPMASNPKTKKQTEELGYHGALMMLLSHTQGDPRRFAEGGGMRWAGNQILRSICPNAVKNGCAKACLVNQGRGRMNVVYKAREARTHLFWNDRKLFKDTLRGELAKLQRSADRRELTAVARLDGTSDLGLAWELCGDFPRMRFYDYTKVKARAWAWAWATDAQRLVGNLPHVTFSVGAGNLEDAEKLVATGRINATVVFRLRKGEALPAEWRGRPVVDGDQHDLRFLDPVGGYWIGLHAKGSAYYDKTGFVQEAN